MPGRFLLVLVLFPLLLSYAEENRSAPTYYYYHLAIDGTYEHITTTQGTPARYQLHVKALIPADDYSLIRFRPTRTPPLSARTTTPGHEPGVSGTFGNLGTRVFVRNFARDILPNLDPNGVYSFTVSPRFTDLRDYTLTITITRCPVDSEEDLPEFGLLSNSSVFNHTTNTLLKKPSPEPTLASHPRQRISSSTTNKSAISLDLAPDNGPNAPREADRRTTTRERGENPDEAPGIFLAVNLLDTDKDGIPDFADGYDLILNNRNQAGNGKSARFTPLFLELNGPIDFARARIRFSYSASDPARIMQQGNGTDKMPYSYTPGRRQSTHLDPGRREKPTQGIRRCRRRFHPGRCRLEPSSAGIDGRTAQSHPVYRGHPPQCQSRRSINHRNDRPGRRRPRKPTPQRYGANDDLHHRQRSSDQKRFRQRQGRTRDDLHPA